MAFERIIDPSTERARTDFIHSVGVNGDGPLERELRMKTEDGFLFSPEEIILAGRTVRAGVETSTLDRPISKIDVDNRHQPNHSARERRIHRVINKRQQRRLLSEEFAY
ncbi:MAG TPA: hypothetical protein VLF63_02720 [Patescibacteria group bacterium]|nr:hypothetical protein [Patescibacteria group bacterium]